MVPKRLTVAVAGALLLMGTAVAAPAAADEDQGDPRLGGDVEPRAKDRLSHAGGA